MLLLILSIVCFLSLSGLMAAVDAAVLSVSRPEIEVLCKQRRWGAEALRDVRARLSQSVVVIVIATNTINVLGPIAISWQISAWASIAWLVPVTVILTAGTIVFSEVIPKSVGAARAPQIARYSAPFIMAARSLLHPIVVALAWLSARFTGNHRKIGTEEQIRALVRIGRDAGLIEAGEVSLIHHAFVLNDKTAGEIMTPIEHVKAMNASMTLNQAIAQICQFQFSRYPVLGQSIDEVLGVVIARDVFAAAQSDPGKMIASVAAPPFIVAADTKSDELLSRFRKEHLHLAIVQDCEKTVGIVTLEDVVEQLVGEIDDEKDVA